MQLSKHATTVLSYLVQGCVLVMPQQDGRPYLAVHSSLADGRRGLGVHRATAEMLIRRRYVIAVHDAERTPTSQAGTADEHYMISDQGCVMLEKLRRREARRSGRTLAPVGGVRGPSPQG